jgi:S1-C subfamily serine protease
MRTAPRLGAEVTGVERGSAGDAAGIAAGDVVTAIGTVDAPTPAQVRSAFASLQRGNLLLVAVQRGETHRVMAIER